MEVWSLVRFRANVSDVLVCVLWPASTGGWSWGAGNWEAGPWAGPAAASHTEGPHLGSERVDFSIARELHSRIAAHRLDRWLELGVGLGSAHGGKWQITTYV